MYQMELELIEEVLKRTEKIENSCKESIDGQYKDAERKMYEAAKTFCMAYEAVKQCKRNQEAASDAVELVNRGLKKFDREDND